MTQATATKVDLVLRELSARQLRGEVAAGPVSTETMARISTEIGQELNEKTFRNIEAAALAKLRNHALARLALEHFRSL